MNIELTQDQVNQILNRAQKQVEQEAVQMLRAAVQSNLNQWIGEVKNATKTAVADLVAKEVIKRLDVNGCVDAAMNKINKRIHTEINQRIHNGITVSFQAVLAKPTDGENTIDNYS